jgi:hypothetical protein
MPPITLLQRQTSYSDDQAQKLNTARITIIVVVIIILILKIALIIYIINLWNRRQRERAARGCHCYDDMDYCCTPWWYWSSDRYCRCNQLQHVAPWQGPPNYQPGFETAPSLEGQGYHGPPGALRADASYGGTGYSYNEPTQLKPAHPRSNDGSGDLSGERLLANGGAAREERVQYG